MTALEYRPIAADDQPAPCGVGVCMAQATHWFNRAGSTVVDATCRQHTTREETDTVR